MAQNVTSAIKSGIAVAAPGMTCGQKILFGVANIFRWGFFGLRKVRLLSNKKNVVPYAIGSVVDVMTKKIPALREVARIPFGSVSILRCVEDLIKMTQLTHLAGRLLRGKEYVVVKKDRFTSSNVGYSPSFQDRARWKMVVVKLQMKLFFKTIGEIFKCFLQLILHLGDVYTAFKENTLPEVFIHSRDLWKKLTSQDSTIVKCLKRTEEVSDRVLQKLGCSRNTNFLLKFFLLPAKIKEKLPDGRDIKEGVVTAAKNKYEHFKAVSEDQVIRDYEMLGGDKMDLEGQQFWIFEPGSKDDPQANRFMKPPVIDLHQLPLQK